MAGLLRFKCFGNGQFNPIKDYMTCHMSWFQAYELAFFKRRAMASQDSLMSKGHHEHCDRVRLTPACSASEAR